MMVLLMKLTILTETDQQEVSMHLLSQGPLQIKLQDLSLKLIGTILMDGIRASLDTAMSGIIQDRLLLMGLILPLAMKKVWRKLRLMDKLKTTKKQH